MIAVPPGPNPNASSSGGGGGDPPDDDPEKVKRMMARAAEVSKGLGSCTDAESIDNADSEEEFWSDWPGNWTNDGRCLGQHHTHTQTHFYSYMHQSHTPIIGSKCGWNKVFIEARSFAAK